MLISACYVSVLVPPKCSCYTLHVKYHILVATPTLGFGEMIRQSLEENANFSVAVASGAETALQLASKECLALAILDSDLEDCSLAEFISNLRQRNPGLRFLVIPPDVQSNVLMPENLPVDGYLSKPFYLPDLINSVDRLLDSPSSGNFDSYTSESEPVKNGRTGGHTNNGVPSTMISNRESAPSWFQDAKQVQATLADIFLPTDACCAFVLRYDQIWAIVGNVPKEIIRDLSMSLANQWSQDSSTDLVRFIHIEACGGENMIYSTHLGDEYILSVIFDAEKPFSEIRKQAGHLAQYLRKPYEFAENSRSSESFTESMSN